MIWWASDDLILVISAILMNLNASTLAFGCPYHNLASWGSILLLINVSFFHSSVSHTRSCLFHMVQIFGHCLYSNQHSWVIPIDTIWSYMFLPLVSLESNMRVGLMVTSDFFLGEGGVVYLHLHPTLNTALAIF